MKTLSHIQSATLPLDSFHLIHSNKVLDCKYTCFSGLVSVEWHVVLVAIWKCIATMSVAHKLAKYNCYSGNAQHMMEVFQLQAETFSLVWYHPFEHGLVCTWEMGWLTYTQPVMGLTLRYSGCSLDMEYVMAALVPKSSSWAATRKKLVPIIVSSRRKSVGVEKEGVIYASVIVRFVSKLLSL